jgi:LysM repeat protein
MLIVAGGLVLSACTRSASPGAVPTVTTGPSAPVEGVTQAPVAQDPTMAALGTAIRMTQTAQAVAGVGGGGEVTATPGGPGDAATAVPTVAAPTPANTPVPPTAAAAGLCANPYTVKGGDWIYKIARDCKMDPAAIIAANPGINPSVLTPGQKLNLPAAGGAVATGAGGQLCTGTHTVVKGENLFRIAYNCGLTTEQLAAVNGVPYPYTIFPGQVLKFP